MEQILPALVDQGGWGLVLLFFFLIFGPWKILSRDTASKDLWLIGRIRQAIQNRKRTEIENTASLEESVIASLRRSIEQMGTTHTEQVALLKAANDAKVASLELRISSLDDGIKEAKENARRERSRSEKQFRYILWITEWARDVTVTHLRHGWEPDIRPWLTMEEWEEQVDSRKEG